MSYSLVVGIPTYGKPDAAFSCDSLSSLMYHIGRRCPEFEKVYLQRDVRTYRQEARSSIVRFALECEATHLLMLDDDHVFDGYQFQLLWDSMKESNGRVEAISAMYFTRGLPTVPCIWKLTAQGTVPIYYYDQNKLMPVDVVGFGFILFDMRLFREKVNPPWFSLSLGFGEDAAFCTRLLNAGVKCWVHTGAMIGHILEQPHIITEADYLQTREAVHVPMGTSQLVPVGTVERRESLEAGDQMVPRSRGWRPDFTRRWTEWWRRDASGPSSGSAPQVAGPIGKNGTGEPGGDESNVGAVVAKA